jgi:serine/threonine-protein kinase
MPPEIGLGILVQALDGLHAAHEATNESGEPLALVHRDFSPQNLLVGADGVVRLTDFGIAKLGDGRELTESGVVKGKFGYLSPEQLRGRQLDRRADVWAAGVVAWELATGERLFDGDQASSMLKLVTERPRRARSVRPEIPESLDDAIAGALALEAKGRWPTAAAFAAQLRAAFPPADERAIAAFVRGVVGETLALRTRDAEVRRSPIELTARTSLRRARSAAVLGTIAVAAGLSAALAYAARSGSENRGRAPSTAALDQARTTLAAATESPTAAAPSATTPSAPTTVTAPSASAAPVVDAPSTAVPQVVRGAATTNPSSTGRVPRASRATAPAGKGSAAARGPSLLDNPYRSE